MANDKENMLPHVLVEVYINENKEIEEVSLLKCFAEGEFGLRLESDTECYNEYALEQSEFLDDAKPDTLYHLYLYFSWYQSGGWGEVEWEQETHILNIIPVIHNYSTFSKNQIDFEEQQNLKERDSELEEIEYEGDVGGYSWSIRPILNYNDFENMAKIISLHDIKLAHRLYTGSTITEVLNDNYDEWRHEIEKKRIKFRDYIKYSNNYKVRYTPAGYEIRSGNFHKLGNNTLTITYDEINAISDDDLFKKKPQEILDDFIDKQIAIIVLNELSQTGN